MFQRPVVAFKDSECGVLQEILASFRAKLGLGIERESMERTVCIGRMQDVDDNRIRKDCNEYSTVAPERQRFSHH